MKKLGFRLTIVCVLLLSMTSFIYLNNCTSVKNKTAVTDVQELTTAKDQILTGMTGIYVIVGKMIDIVTTRKTG